MAGAAFRHPSAGAYSNAAQVSEWLGDKGPLAEARGHALVVQYTALLKTRVMAAASGRPGPRVITGDYRRSINGRTQKLAGMSTGTVGTNAPQARRLEYGYVGADRLGRVYNQPPYPHFGPAWSLTAPEFTAAMMRVLE